MDILSLIGWRAEGRAQTDHAQAPALKLGDRLEGRVTRLLQRDLAVVELFGGRVKAVAALKTPLVQGQRLHLEVTATTPRLTFQRVGTLTAPDTATAPAAITSSDARPDLHPHQLRSLIDEVVNLAARIKGGAAVAMKTEGEQVSAALARLAVHLRPLDLSADLKTMATQLQARVRDGGLFFEQKLAAAARHQTMPMAEDPTSPAVTSVEPAKSSPMPGSLQQHLELLKSDLKPNLQRLFMQLPALMETLAVEQRLSAEASRQLWSTAATLLEEIEGGRERLATHRPEDGPAVVRHSLWIEGRDEALRFNVYLPRRGDRKGERGKHPAEAPMISLLLQLERFGSLRVDVREFTSAAEPARHPSKRLGVDFWAASQKARDDLQSTLAPLAQMLETLYPLVDLKISLSPEKINAFEAEAPPSVSTVGDRPKLDLHI
jgi:hypothetical protein